MHCGRKHRVLGCVHNMRIRHREVLKSTKRFDGDIMLIVPQRCSKFLPKLPFPIFSTRFRKPDGEQLGSLRSSPGIPVPLKRLVIHKRRVSARFVRFVLLLHRLEFPVCVDVPAEHQPRRVGDEPKVYGRRAWREGAYEDGALWRIERLGGELDGDGVELVS